MGWFDRLKKIVSPLGVLESVAIKPGDCLPTPFFQLMQSASHKSRGDALLGQGKLEEAAASYWQAIAENPLMRMPTST